MLTYRGAGESAPVLPIVRLKGVVRSGGIAPMSSIPPASTVPLAGSQPSSTHTQQPESVLMVRLGTCRAPMVLAVGSAVWLPVMFFQLCDRLSHWGLNFHSAPSHQRLQLTMPAGLLPVRSFEGRSRKPLGRVTCTEVFSAPIGWACAGSGATAAHSASSICPPALRQRLVGMRAWAWWAWAASVSNLSVML